MKGSRRAILDLIDSPKFLDRINNILPENVEINMNDNWIPKSFSNPNETYLNDFLNYNFSKNMGSGVYSWWLKKNRKNNGTPQWDLITTCSINNKRGILLVEGKAHFSELEENNSCGAIGENRESINLAVEHINQSLNKTYPKINLKLEECYQLSNRIAHAWWLANYGIPVVLLYLGFLNCNDIDYGNRKLFKNDDDWQKCFRDHAKLVGADSIINKWIDTGNEKFVLICKSL